MFLPGHSRRSPCPVADAANGGIPRHPCRSTSSLLEEFAHLAAVVAVVVVAFCVVAAAAVARAAAVWVLVLVGEPREKTSKVSLWAIGQRAASRPRSGRWGAPECRRQGELLFV